MSKTKIEWCDYSINPVKGLCPMDCKDNQGKSYCYARRMYKRFHWNPTVRYDDWCWHEGPRIPPGSKVFVGSTMELFGPWVTDEWRETILDYCDSSHSRTFIFLTKCPQNLPKEWPDNCWVGFSATDKAMLYRGLYHMLGVKARIRFASIEPLRESLATPYHVIRGLHLLNWLIIGQQTPIKASTRSHEAWVEEIVRAADKAGIPVFLKDNLTDLALLQSLCYKNGKLRQEFPEHDMAIYEGKVSG